MKQYQTKKEMIYQSIKAKIYDGHYRPGEKIVIARIAKEYDCSDIPVREALSLLESDKLIAFKPHVGAIVSHLSLDEIENIFNVRKVLEGYATALATDHLKDEDIHKLEEILSTADEAYNEHDYTNFNKLNNEFHMTIYNKSNNDILVQLIEDLWKNANRYDSVFEKNDTYIQQSIEEHYAILKLLKEKNSTSAQEKMLKHMERVGSEIKKISKKSFDRLTSLREM